MSPAIIFIYILFSEDTNFQKKKKGYSAFGLPIVFVENHRSAIDISLISELKKLSSS